MFTARLNQRSPLLAAVPLGIAALELAACGGGHPGHARDAAHDRPQAQPVLHAPAATTQPTGFSTGPSTVVRAPALGRRVELHTRDTTLVVSVDKVMAPLTVGEYATADPGNRFVGVRLTVRNVGGHVYDGSDYGDATARAADGTELKHDVAIDGPCTGEVMRAIAPGETRRGCLVYQAPLRTLPHTIRISPDDGFGTAAAEWPVPRSTPDTARYPRSARAALIRGCMTRLGRSSCTCIIDEMRRGVSWPDLQAMEPDFTAGNPPTRWLQTARAAGRACRAGSHFQSRIPPSEA